MFRQFEFEEGLYEQLERVPLSTQFKLDSLGLALPLGAWDCLALPERWVLCHLSVRSKGERECFTQYLAYILQRDGVAAPPRAPVDPRKPWEEVGRLPPEVARRMGEMDLPLFWPEWIKLDDMERYVLFKLCGEDAEGGRLSQAVREFLGSSRPISAPTA